DPVEDGNPAPGRVDTWKEETSPFLKEKRLYNHTEETPSVDDSFRADNRYGPKPRIDGENIPGHIGETIQGDDDLTRLGAASGDEADDFNNVGLDGYWERRARAEGARVIVGQRLELGNTFGWGGGVDESSTYIDALDAEPLMPWNGCNEYDDSSRCAEARQRRTLRDNLAAVQTAAIYHGNATVTNADPDFPLACLASTVHPGSPYTLQDSATFLDKTQGLEAFWDVNFFDSVSNANDPDLLFISDFFRGEGTNGWEYDAPSGGNPNTFATDIGPTQPLGRALRNLAYFAGDPKGGAPSFTPTQDTNVHPYPLLAMWGDFSILRRIIEEELDNGVSYDDLSPADKATLQTAACSLGMLANELYYLEKFDYNRAPLDTKYDPDGINTDGHTLLDVLDARLYALSVDRNRDSYDSGYTNQEYWAEPPIDQDKDSGEFQYYNDVNTIGTGFDGLNGKPPEAYIARLEQWRDSDLIAFENPTIADPNERLQQFNVDDDLINLAKIILLREQMIHDRTYGFDDGRVSPSCDGLDSDAYNPDPSGPRFVFPAGGGIESALCSVQPKFGALYSIFPGDDSFFTNRGNGITADDDHGEEINKSRGLNSSDLKAITDDFNPDTDIYSAFNIDALNAIRLEPRQPNEWILPNGNLGTVDDHPYKGFKVNPNYSGALLVTCNVELCSSGTSASSGYEDTLYQTQTMQVALKDASLYDGREYMGVRAMDIDLDLLRNSNNGLASSDRWLPNSGIFYAFREDAVREDSITRPSQEDWENCNTDEYYVSGTSDCQMKDLDLAAEEGHDPPLSSTNSISPKSVDYHADPDRRPHGFRLRNGAKLQRPNDEGRGLSFISDNAVYLQGNFNLHQNSAGTTLEEFSDILLFDETSSDFSRFYERKVRDSQFATVTEDEWRPSEILADAITILSDNFCDGSMFDSFRSAQQSSQDTIKVTAEDGANRRVMRVMDGGTLKVIQLPWRSLYNCTDPEGNLDQTSYTNGVFPRIDATGNNRLDKAFSNSGVDEYWHHENPYTTKSAFAITRQGNPKNPQNASTYQGGYYSIGENSPNARPGRATNMSVNAILISGSVPSRIGQSYGGLHNFPRFIERWRYKGLRIAGSLMQLSFSNASTAPYDHDSWEPGTDAKPDSEVIDYYWAPKRLWGYDVGLQKGVAGPMAKRFVSGAEPTRSEFYSEPPADDPYIRNLCGAISDTCS
ncbi:MAG: hypothetical protein F6K16_37890, partial [Symploca sp. SIO2B6]|nr:hypothetical protein [Symploca sp. SIO2B6]